MKRSWQGLILPILMCLMLSTNAQVILNGTVSQSGAPAAGATVSLGNSFQLTDSAGRFSFRSLQPGRQVLHISLVGFEPYHRVIQLAKDETRELEVSLNHSEASLDAIVVTGTMRPVKKLESPIAVEVYSPQFFKKNPAPSIFESLQHVNGVRPQINCSVCNTGDIHINGLEGPYTMVTIDGMPIVSSLSSVYGLFGIPSEMIERVEIVKGPASGLYGSEAIGGLINIITKSPEKAPLFSATLMGTSWRELNTDLGVKWKLGKKIQSLLGVNYVSYDNPADKNGDQFTDVALQDRISIFNKWSIQRKLNRTATLAGRYFYESRWGGDMRWAKQFRGTDSIYGESIYTRRWELIGNYQLPLNQPVFFSFSATGHHQDSYYGTTPYLATQKILFGQLRWDKSIRNHNLLIGAALRHNYYDDNSTATIDTLTKLNAPERYTLPGVFVQDEWKLSPAHTLLLGLRYDHHPVHKTILTPRIAYKWQISRKESLRLNGGTGFRVVNLFTEDHAALTGARAVEIREELKPETSYNLNLNYSRQWTTPSYSWLVDAAVWYSHFSNQIIADYDTDPNKIIYDNLDGAAVSRGFTLNLEANLLKRIKVLAGVTLQDVKKIETIDGIKTRQRPVLTESWSGTWALSYTLPLQRLTIDYTGNIYGPMRLPLASAMDPRQPYSPVWSIQNIQLTKWISEKLEVFGGIKNLLNWTPAKNNPFLIARSQDPFDKNLEYDGNGNVLATPDNPYALSFDPSYIYAPNQGMRAFAGLRFRIK
ncbi:MAG TPA: TonB-dependent receptor [Flavisolibacter sp.]|nr:TonB-dependent receptor [Flavisolibacter sp.]